MKLYNRKRPPGRFLWTAATIVIVTCFTAGSACRASRSYHVTKLGTYSPMWAALNDSGQIAGYAPSSEAWGAFPTLYNSYGPRAGEIQPVLGSEVKEATAGSINNAGQFVGSRWVDGVGSRPFVWDGRRVADLETPPGGGGSYAVVLNNKGQAAGNASWDTDKDYPETIATIWREGRPTALETTPDHERSNANAINDAGQVVGVFFESMGHEGAVSGPLPGLWEADGSLVQIGTLGGSSGYAADVNEGGEVVGNAMNADESMRPFLYTNGAMVDLGTLGGLQGAAIDLNDRGQIIGVANTADGGWSPFLHENGLMFNLNDLIGTTEGLRLSQVHDINNQGQILAEAIGLGGSFVSVLLTPTTLPAPAAPGPVPSVPEPSVLEFAGLVGVALGVRRWRRCGSNHRLTLDENRSVE